MLVFTKSACKPRVDLSLVPDRAGRHEALIKISSYRSPALNLCLHVVQLGLILTDNCAMSLNTFTVSNRISYIFD